MENHSTNCPPSRSEAIEQIRKAHQAASSSRWAILISGAAGIGKTTLIHSAFQGLPNGLVGLGKGEQFGSAHPYRPIVEALNDALRRWLPAAPPSEVQFLRNAVEGYQDLLISLLPALQTAWGATDPKRVLTIEQRNRTPFALRMLVQAMSGLSTPLVLVLDDFQWLDEETLKRMEWGFSDPDLKSVLCIFCCRDEAPLIQRARQFIEKLATHGGHVQEIPVGPLSHAEIVQTVCERLQRPESELGSQIRLLSESSGGSPLYLQHALDLILAGESLGTENQSASGDVLQLLTRQLESFSAAEREVLGLVACSGREVSLALLTSAAELVAPEVDVANLVKKAAESGFCLVGGLPVKIQMTHDRVQEACAGSPTSWPARHLALFKAGITTLPPPRELDDQKLFWMLDREFTATALLMEHPLRLQALQLALVASERARNRAANQTAERASALAHRLLLESDTRETRIAVLLEHAVVSWLIGDSHRFLVLSNEVESIGTPLELVPMTELHLRDAIARGEMSKTVDLALEAATRLLPELPRRPIQEGLGQWNTPTCAPGSLLDRLDHLTPNDDRTAAAVTSLLTTANAAAYVGEPERLACLIATQLDLALQVGITPSFPLTLAYWSAILTTSGETLGLAVEIGERALALSRLGSDGLIQARTADLVYGMVLCWKEDLRQVIHPLLQNRDLALRHGTFEYAGYSLLKSLTYRLYTGSSLASLARDVRAGRAQMLSLRQVRIARYLERDEAVLRLLQEPGSRPSLLSDSQFDGAALQTELQQSGDRYGLFYTAVARLLLAVVYEEVEESLALSVEAERLRDGGPGLAHQAMLSWLSALAQLSGSDTRDLGKLASAQASLKHLEIVCRHAPHPWAARAAFVRAEMFRHQGLAIEAEGAFEDALQQATRSGLILDEILICQRRAQLLSASSDSQSWRQRGEAAMERWRSRAQSSAAEMRPDQLLEAAAKLASSPNVEMGSDLGRAAVEHRWRGPGNRGWAG